MEVIAEGHERVRVNFIPFLGGEGRQRPERAFGLAFWRLPVQTLLLAGVTDELQSVLFRASVIVTLGKVLGLSIGECSTNIDDCQFIPTNAAIQNFILPATVSKNHCPVLFFFSGSIQSALRCRWQPTRRSGFHPRHVLTIARQSE
jgi:hypothetical protein